MFREHTSQVLVVGAGPVGMLTAFALARQGVKVELIDQGERATGRSYGCLLHPRSLRILAELGLEDAVTAVGRKVERVAFYEGQSRCAELNFSWLPGKFPFLVVLPQNELEDLFKERLAQQFRTAIRWEHRLADLGEAGDQVTAAIEKLTETAKGYPIATWQHVVQRTMRSQTAFVVGADGRGSHTRQLLNIEQDRAAGVHHFAAFEFESDTETDAEVRIVEHEGTFSALWPLPGNRWRWTFQTNPEEAREEEHLKERLRFRLVDPASDDEVLQEMRRLIERRAPWFDVRVEALDWFTTMDFEPRVARRYGSGRCWLAGDAAHTIDPIGMQSMNLGLSEGAELARILGAIVHQEGSLDLLERYNTEYQEECRQLLGMENNVISKSAVPPWVQAHGTRLVPCVPACGEDLALLLAQIGLEFRSSAHAFAGDSPLEVP